MMLHFSILMSKLIVIFDDRLYIMHVIYLTKNILNDHVI